MQKKNEEKAQRKPSWKSVWVFFPLTPLDKKVLICTNSLASLLSLHCWSLGPPQAVEPGV